MKTSNSTKRRIVAIVGAVCMLASLVLLTAMPAGAGTVTGNYPLPTLTGTPIHIAVGPDGNLWCNEFNSGKLARTTLDGVVTEFPVATPGDGLYSVALIQNPNASVAGCDVTYMIEGEGPRTVHKTVAPNTRSTFNVADDIGAKDASIQVSSDVHVIPERAMYRYDRREGHDSIGTTTPNADYYLAEGTTAWGFTTYVLVQNPNPNPNTVTVTYMTSAGPVVEPAFVMQPNSRETIRVNDVVPNVDLSAKVSGTLPLIAERAMYYTNDGEICHDSIGLPAAHRTFFLPDGDSHAGCETLTLVHNPNDVPVGVSIVYMTAGGTGNRTLTDTVPARSRRTYLMNDALPGVRASVFVKCTTAGRNIMVERAMYTNNRNTATDTIGGFSDL